jgi:hypothetical protein
MNHKYTYLIIHIERVNELEETKTHSELELFSQRSEIKELFCHWLHFSSYRRQLILRTILDITEIDCPSL